MPVRRQDRNGQATRSHLWPSGGRHLWPSGGGSGGQSHARGHLVYAATGVLAVHTDRGTSIAPANRVAWTPAGYTHEHRAHGDTDMRIVFVGPAAARSLPDRPAVLLASGIAREIMLALTGRDNYREATPRYRGAARARLLRVLVDELGQTEEQPLHLPDPKDDRLQALARILAERPADRSSLTELGKAIGASSRTLSRLLRDELGMTFYEWRTQLRIYHALVLMADGYDTTQTAYACGWANPSSFIAAFAAVMGSTPGRYRAGRENAPRG
ncbi:MAG: helix-turn-helix domain-containing protein [Jatrophihabitans sp.]|uniref:AraC family transcriptional regulator n=1 Tax=Jatrophihabitans sp. TaxID=1932789 RepID=UPI003913F755